MINSDPLKQEEQLRFDILLLGIAHICINIRIVAYNNIKIRREGRLCGK